MEIPDHVRMIMSYLEYPDIISMCMARKSFYRYCKDNPEFLELKRWDYVSEMDAEIEADCEIFRRYHKSYESIGYSHWEARLILTCYRGDLKKFKYILRFHSVDPNVYNLGILEAVKSGNMDIVKILLSKDFYTDDHLIEAIDFAMIRDPEIALEIIRDGRYALWVTGASLGKLMISAIEYGNSEIVRLLLELDEPDLNTTKIMNRAKQSGNHEIVEMLMADRRF